jgi:hypothetical protein
VVINALLLASASNALLVVAVAALLRIYNHRLITMQSLVGRSSWDRDILQALRQILLDLADPLWTSSGRYMPPTTVIPKVEESDREHTLQDLLSQIASDAEAAFSSDIKLASLEQFVKSVYRLQSVYGFDDALMVEIFAATVERVKGAVLLSEKVDRVDLVKIGARVDEKIMWPLNSGLRVKQPFGIVLRTESGEVLSRAKAHCQ